MVLTYQFMVPGFSYKQTSAEPPGDHQDQIIVYDDLNLLNQDSDDEMCCSVMTSTWLARHQVQAVKLNIGVTVTANLAIFLFLVQVDIKQIKGEVWHLIL